MPPVAYALASDTLIGVVRSWVIARHQDLNVTLAVEEVTPLAVLGGLALWVLRLSLAPVSTLAGFRAWVLKSAHSSRAPRRPPGSGSRRFGLAAGDRSIAAEERPAR